MRNLVAAGFALTVTFYSVSDGNAGHLELQCALLLLGGIALFEQIAAMLDGHLDR